MKTSNSTIKAGPPLRTPASPELSPAMGRTLPQPGAAPGGSGFSIPAQANGTNGTIVGPPSGKTSYPSKKSGSGTVGGTMADTANLSNGKHVK